MPPQLALLLCWGGILWLLRQDTRWRHAGSMALWLPGIFLGIQGSRPLSFWFGSSGGGGSAEGNPINTAAFAVYIVAALVVLARRGFQWSDAFQRNRAVFLVYAYFLASALWSELPVVSLKRIVKDFTCVLLAFVILTEQDPAAAFRALIVRVAYILFPLSVVFGKYFPDLGRGYTQAGEPMFTGVADQKNTLGLIVYVFGLVLLWDWMELRKHPQRPGYRLQVFLRGAMLAIGLWLLVTCDSKTSLVCLVLGAGVLWISPRLVRMAHGRQVLTSGLVAVGLLIALDKSLGISQWLIAATGRDPTLTGRTGIWQVVLEQNINPLLGTGFYVFWDTAKGEAVVDALARIKSIHNGYLETYADGGMLGCALLGLMLWSGIRRVIGRLFLPSALGMIGLVFWTTACIHNFSESTFFRLNPLWFTLLLVVLEPPFRRLAGPPPAAVAGRLPPPAEVGAPSSDAPPFGDPSVPAEPAAHADR